MIVVDSSALISILDREPDAALYAEAIAEADSPLISAATLLDCTSVMLNRHGRRAGQLVDRLIQDAGFQIEHFTAQHLELAREAYARYGKGRNQCRAQLWRLFLLRAGKGHRLAVALQGGRFFKNGLAGSVGQHLSKESSLTPFPASHCILGPWTRYREHRLRQNVKIQDATAEPTLLTCLGPYRAYEPLAESPSHDIIAIIRRPCGGAMANLIVRNVDEKLIKALKARAGRRGVSAEAEHREILAQALLKSRKRSFAEVIAAMPNVGKDADFERAEDEKAPRVFD